MSLPITYKYECFRQGVYLGILPKVTSQFTYTQDINTPGCQTVITVAQDIDTQQLATSSLTDESSNQLTDESGNALITDRAPDVYGDKIFSSMIQNGNEIRVWEYTQFQPNGVKVFDGFVQRWNPHIGNNDSVDITVNNYGVELNNNILYGELSADQAVTTPDSTGNIIDMSNSPFSLEEGAQTFLTGPDITNISGIMLQFYPSSIPGYTPSPNMTVQLYTYTPGANPDSGSLIASVSGTANQTIYGAPTSVPFTTISFGSPITVNPYTYYSVVFSVSSEYTNLLLSSDTYSDGSAWQYESGAWTVQTESIVFITLAQNSEGAFTNSIYFSQDPSAMLTNFMGNYISGGGHCGIGNITSSNALGTYPFVLNTVLEGLTACLSMSPSGYYWYVDPGSNLLYYQPKNSTPDHTLTFKVHFSTYELLVTSENTINSAYLTAGTDAFGNAILAYAENIHSVANFGQVLDRITDSRIIDAPTAQLVINNYVTTNSIENYQSTVNIMASNYDLTTLKLGQVIATNGSGTYLDTIKTQIVNIARYSDYVTLTLGTVPKRGSTKAQRIENSLLATQTINNPLSAI
jgi:hypothetical protein